MMKNFILPFIVVLLFSFGKIVAQQFTVSAFTGSELEVFSNNKTNLPMPYWQENWTNESVLAINKIINEFGYPNESTPNRMHWIIPGEIQRTITYTENFLFLPPFKPNYCNNANEAIVITNSNKLIKPKQL
jgi:hypothetical protein